jgi:hypothetical protein
MKQNTIKGLQQGLTKKVYNKGLQQGFTTRVYNKELIK